jgi:hydrogenase nickel incorporation protein HypA/HybF
MHELSVCQALLREVESIAEHHAARQVRSVTLKVGPLCGVESRLLQEAFPSVALGTIADGSMLHIENVPLRVRCQFCHAESDASLNRLVCAICGDWRTTLLSGSELLLTDVELVT